MHIFTTSTSNDPKEEVSLSIKEPILMFFSTLFAISISSTLNSGIVWTSAISLSSSSMGTVGLSYLQIFLAKIYVNQLFFLLLGAAYFVFQFFPLN